jgi:hypothetical protein
LAKFVTLCINNIKSSIVMDVHVTRTPQPQHSFSKANPITPKEATSKAGKGIILMKSGHPILAVLGSQAFSPSPVSVSFVVLSGSQNGTRNFSVRQLMTFSP